tara:strand:- start:4335 stop:5207 length:873 start_codon:yes stop_codon:yes gene_type:complete
MDNICYFLLSSRKNILHICLANLIKNLNKEKYPIYVYYFDNIYDEKYIEKIKSYLKFDNIFFKQLEYNIPEFINEKDLYFNRKYLPYVRNYFPRSRVGYLHMENFVSNFYNLEDLKKYEYLIRIDDDSYFKSDLNNTSFFIESLKEKKCQFGSAHFWNHIGENTLQTRENLFSFTKEFIKKNNLKVKNSLLSNAIRENNENNFHKLKWSAGNFNIYKSEIFKEKMWLEWIKEINYNGFIYKHRWGDQEIIGLYYYMTRENNPVDFKLKEKGLYGDKIPGCGEAPSTKKLF